MLIKVSLNSIELHEKYSFTSIVPTLGLSIERKWSHAGEINLKCIREIEARL